MPLCISNSLEKVSKTERNKGAIMTKVSNKNDVSKFVFQRFFSSQKHPQRSPKICSQKNNLATPKNKPKENLTSPRKVLSTRSSPSPCSFYSCNL